MRAFSYLLTFACAGLFLLLAGGFLVDHLNGYPAPAFGARWIVFLAAGILAAGGAARLSRADGRRFLFSAILFALLALMSAVASNVAVSFVVPRWPVNALHGARPGTYWRDTADAFTSFNSWGQRDEERAVRPAPGVRRFAFVGDSFLEESERPVSLVVEKLLGPGNEVINLGVSVSGPDEYYFRTKNVALPLRADHVVVFYYEGNDTLKGDTLRSFWGVAAVYPRDSVLSRLSLLAINHVLTNRFRPYFRSWGEAEAVVAAEKRQIEAIARADDAALKGLLVGMVSEPFRPALAKILEKEEARRLFAAIRAPDDGLYRSYLLADGLGLAAGERGVHGFVDPERSLHWIRRIAALCRRKGVRFTLVLVPEAFEVDTRMRSQYAVLGDMKKMYGNRHSAGDELKKRATGEMDIVDLRDAFEGRGGTYLNLDGHWSREGLRLAAETVAAAIRPAARP